MQNPEQLYQYIDEEWEQAILPSLSDYINIPNKSPHFDKDWEKHGFMEQAVTHIASWCEHHAVPDMCLDIIRLPGRTPVLFMDIPGTSDETVLLYGHLDKQPEMVGWHKGKGPWQAVLQDGKLYGRGGADDGYAAYASLTAIRALRSQGLSHARCVILIEACEESGSYDLPYYIDHLAERIGKPSLVICLDSGAGNYEQLWVTTSLRGNIVGELQVSLLREGVHSGAASGIVADSFRVIRQLLERIENGETGELRLPELYCEIPSERQKQAALCADVLGSGVYQSLPLQAKIQAMHGNGLELILNRTWRPSLTVTGAQGLPSVLDAGNVLRPETVLKLSVRIPPLICPEKAANALQKALTTLPPYHAEVSFHLDSVSPGWHAPLLEDWFSQALEKASTTFYQKPVVFLGEGGTIPFMGMLGEKFPNAQFMITGVLGPHSNAHGPNEFLHIGMAKKITACVSFVLHAHYQHKTSCD